MQFKIFLISPIVFISVLYPISSNTAEAHETLSIGITKIQQRMKRLHSRIAKFETQAQQVRKQVKALKQRNKDLKDYRNALEEEMDVEVMGFKSEDFFFKDHIKSNLKKKNSVCKNKYAFNSLRVKETNNIYFKGGKNENN